MNAAEVLNRIDTWGRARNIIGEGKTKDQFPKLVSELGELADGIAKGDHVAIKDGIGDVIVVLTMIAGIEGLTIEECLKHAYNEIKDRTGVLFDGVFIKSTDPRYAAAVEEIDARRRVMRAGS